jgi:hypothetical protein
MIGAHGSRLAPEMGLVMCRVEACKFGCRDRILKSVTAVVSARKPVRFGAGAWSREVSRFWRSVVIVNLTSARIGRCTGAEEHDDTGTLNISGAISRSFKGVLVRFNCGSTSAIVETSS